MNWDKFDTKKEAYNAGVTKGIIVTLRAVLKHLTDKLDQDGGN